MLNREQFISSRIEKVTCEWAAFSTLFSLFFFKVFVKLTLVSLKAFFKTTSYDFH